ncbi:hypothetical protein [Zobellia laminariae]|uniref:hypothetical protein n=1 Tax=Zobellia laminariae TaxID=248906 RepID=UPI0026F47992|nr:hypothetical protein [Zobellia laminariae]WKX77564.1 hypothetical protein Q5W13_05890 [Zobellia laminariae]
MQFKLMAQMTVLSIFSLAGLFSFFGGKEMPQHEFSGTSQSEVLDHTAQLPFKKIRRQYG